MAFDEAVTTGEQLRAIYRQPAMPAVRKQIDAIDGHCRELLARSPFVVIATAGARGACDVSPKGGPPGFVTVLDERRLVVPDLAGNNRLDSMENLLENPGIALLVVVPGIDETLRVNGRATITTSPAVLAACAVDGRTPHVAIGVDVDEAYIHCGKAFRRGGLWDPATWPATDDMASVGTMLRDHIELDMSGEEVDAVLEDGYRRTLWQVGGDA